MRSGAPIADNGHSVASVVVMDHDVTSRPATPERHQQFDLWLAVGIGVVQVGITYLASRHQPERRAWDLLAVALLCVGPAALFVRRRYPIGVLVLASATVLAYWVIGYARGPVFFAMIVALYTAILAGKHRAAAAVVAVCYVGFQWLGPALHRDRGPSLGGSIGLAAWLLVLFGACELLRIRHERGLEAVHMREEETRRRVSEERVRIARELHDVIAHNISLINVQAATTLHLLDGDGVDERAQQALSTIKAVSQETLVELRSVLGALRQVDEAAPRAPAPTLERLDELIASSGVAGVTAHVEIGGTRRQLPSAVDLAAYRIIQESLTNVARHAGTAWAMVRVRYGEGDLVVQVEDDGRASGPVVAGNGITGMTERATALGGTLNASRVPGGGFRVRAWFPLESLP